MTLEDLINSGSANLALIEKMYAQYITDPWSLEEKWRKIFEQFEDTYRTPTTARSAPLENGTKQESVPQEVYPVVDKSAPPDLRVYHLIQAYRTYGHLMAKTNPIEVEPQEEPWQLRLDTLGFSREELPKMFPTNGLLVETKAPLKEIIAVLREIYCGNIGVEYMGIQDPQLELWLQKHIEPRRFKIDLTIEQKKMILQHLNKSELFESFLHTKYVGQKRFSLEGGETLIPILAAVIETGADLGLKKYVLGMAHRGRLNVLSNIMEKSYSLIFSEFEEGYIPVSFEGSGDVKYHKGYTSSLTTAHGHKVDVILTPNPSHLEAVDPVVQGQVGAIQILMGDDSQEKAVPLLIHGDAAISGQGVVYETMQLYDLEGYSTGGTIHIVINNQIGFTTLPKDGRSTHYCTDIARTFNAPVFHVNAEDPEACVFATNLAVEMRQKFHCDVFIDIICYRKYGHNEADEPAFTQPLEYQIIRKKKPIREIYRDALIRQGVLERQMAEALEEEFKQALQKALGGARYPETTDTKPPLPEVKPMNENDIFSPFETGVPLDLLKEIGLKLSQIPEGLTIHRKLEKVIADRMEMIRGEKPVDWGMGEILAYATLLWQGKSVRISGQDSCRGTFSHRHALWMDQVAERAYYPLKHLNANQGRFDVFNSPLSEFAILGFEFGYSIANPQVLVLWEAQFGDFCNGAQVIIDQFISTSEMKWGQKNSVVLLLPHGYEGQGPEHSSARMERFLALCGNRNMQVVYPTLPSQLFHLLRRQALKPMNKPLIIFTPKGLLRHPACISKIEEFTKGSFREILDDIAPPKVAKNLVYCTGRIYYDLIAERNEREVSDMAIIRIEQLYPFHSEGVEKSMDRYKGFKKCYWVQEEPSNMGAWNFIQSLISGLLPKGLTLEYIGRKRSASPAAGSFALHKKEYARMMDALFGEKKTKQKGQNS